MPAPGLVPGPPGPNIGELEVEGELDVDGELEVDGWPELVPPPLHPVMVMKMHKIIGQVTRVDSHLAITALDEIKCLLVLDVM